MHSSFDPADDCGAAPGGGLRRDRPPAPPAAAAAGSAVQRPRERLARLGPEALTDAELLALLLRTGAAGRDAVGLAGDLLAAELSRRLAGHRLDPGQPLRSPEDVHRHFYPRLRDVLHERFLALLLDGRHRVLREVAISQGTLTASLVHPREVFRAAVREAAAALVLVHNHPSGEPAPSREDREVTRRLVRAGEVVGVRVVDHVVVAERGYYSFREAGELPE